MYLPASPDQFLENSSTVRLLIQKALSQFRLDSIRGQILVFAILAAIVPSLIISLIAYAQSRRALTEKLTQELVITGSQAGREATNGISPGRIFPNLPTTSR